MEEQKNISTTVESQNFQPIVKEPLPNAGLVLTLGILSIPFCCCFPISLPLGIIAWVMGHRGLTEYKENPEAYTRSSYSNMNTGKITAIIGVVLTILYWSYNIYSIIKMGGWDVYMDTVRQMTEQYQ